MTDVVVAPGATVSTGRRLMDDKMVAQFWLMTRPRDAEHPRFMVHDPIAEQLSMADRETILQWIEEGRVCLIKMNQVG